jgi:hypothetical protein
MDRMYFITAIENLERERAVHDTKFAHNPAHEQCLPNFDQAIAKLRAELDKVEAAALVKAS